MTDQKKYKTPFQFQQEKPEINNPFNQQPTKTVISTPFPQKLTKQKEQVELQPEIIQQNNQIKINLYQENYEDNQLQGVINLNEPLENKPSILNDDDEPPLLEDLGINIENIKMKWKTVLFFKKCEKQFAEQSDMSGPLLLAIILGCLLMINGKIHFGYIYGFSVLGSISIYCIINFLSQQNTIDLYNTMSILGYCQLPIVILAAIAIFIKLTDFMGLIICILCVLWATYCSSEFFDEALELNNKRWLVAYPCCLFYATFVLITIF